MRSELDGEKPCEGLDYADPEKGGEWARTRTGIGAHRAKHPGWPELATGGISSGNEDTVVQAFYFSRHRKNSRNTGAG